MRNPFEIKNSLNFDSRSTGSDYGSDWDVDPFFSSKSSRPDIKKPFYKHQKIRWLYFVILAIFIVLFSRTFFLQIVQGDSLKSAAEENRFRINITRAPRGVIYDSKKNLLVKNVPSFDAIVIPADLPLEKNQETQIRECKSKCEDVFSQLKSILKISDQDFKEAIKKIDYNSYETFLIKENISRDETLVINSRDEELPGILVEKNPIRDYQYSTTFAHLMGYIGKITSEELDQKKNTSKKYLLNDYIGKQGLELSYEETLKGINGQQQVEVDSSGRVKKIVKQDEPKPGNDVVLSINKDFQIQLEKSLTAGSEAAKSKKAAAVALDPQNGEILAYVSLPNYDNNLFAKGISETDYRKIANDLDKPLLDRVINGIYPPASTIKPVVASAALTEGLINENTTVEDKGTILVPNKYNPDIVYKFVSWNLEGLGPVNVYNAIARSSDIYFYYVGGGFEDFPGLGEKKLEQYYKKFGLGQLSGIDLPNEATGLIPTPEWKEKNKNEVWYLGDTYHMATGQGDVLSTPLQVANWTATIANGGTFYKPRLVKKIIYNEQNMLSEIEPKIIRENFIPENHINTVRQAMRETVLSGSAQSLQSLKKTSAGKTGTAEHGGSDKNHAWFTVFAPYDNPEIVLTIIIEEGGGGESTAVPIAKEVLEWYFNNR